MRRSGKFYSRNEKETLTKLGFKPVAMSGAGWIDKEDGESEIALVQLKSTDANSYTLKMQDMKELEYHASVSHKLPIFLVQFLKQDKIYAIVDVDNINELSNAIKTGEVKDRIQITENVKTVERKVIKSSSNARNDFFKERERKYGKHK